MNNDPVGILLAAGQSRRFGSNKLLHPVNGTPMLFAAARKLVAVLPRCLVVISHGLQDYRPQLQQLGLEVVVNQESELGMGSSIACGVAASADASGWLIALADMPYIHEDTVRSVARRLQAGAAIVAPRFAGQRGHPVAFSRDFKEELLVLDNDAGARSILECHHDSLVVIETDDEGVVVDIDRREQV